MPYVRWSTVSSMPVDTISAGWRCGMTSTISTGSALGFARWNELVEDAPARAWGIDTRAGWARSRFPELVGKPKYLDDGRTCVVQVKLQPGKFYATWLNSEKFRNFKGTNGQPAVPYLLTFTTAAAKAPPAK